MTKTLREKGIKGLFLVSALFSMAALATITVFLLISGIPFIAHTGVAEFLLGRRWAILESPPSYGILPMIVATLYVTALSVILGTILDSSPQSVFLPSARKNSCFRSDS